MTAAIAKIENVTLWGDGGTVDVVVPICQARLVDDGGAVSRSTSDAVITFDGTGLILAPGLTDPHVHFRDPGFTDKETMVTGARAAAAGGYTTVLLMPNTDPAVDGGAVDADDTDTLRRLDGHWSSLDYLEHYEEDHHVLLPVRYALSVTASKGRKGEKTNRFRFWQYALATSEFFAHPVVAITDDGASVPDAIIDEVARRCILAGVPLIDHCERHTSGVMNEGDVSRRLGLPGIPAQTETQIVERDIDLARRTGCHVHLQHVSCAGSVELVRKAKDEGLPVTCETAPHYIALTDEAVEKLGTNAKMNPPLRTEADRQAILAGIADGTIDMIATDHAPHTPDEKAQGMESAPNGVIGLETAYGVCRTVLVEGGVISDDRLIEMMSVAPALLMGAAASDPAAGVANGMGAGSWPRPVIDLTASAHVGTTTSGFQSDEETRNPGDFTLIDPSATWTVDPEAFHSKGRNTPFAGMTLTGRAVATIIGSRIVFSRLDDSRLVALNRQAQAVDSVARATFDHAEEKNGQAHPGD